MSEPKKFKFVEFIVNKPLMAIACAVAILLVLAPGVKGLVPNFTHTAFFTDDDPMVLQFNDFEKQFSNDDNLLIAVKSPSGIFDEDSALLLQEITKEMWLVPDIIRVDSLSNFNWVHDVDDVMVVEALIPKKVSMEEAKAVETLALKEGLLEAAVINGPLTQEMIAALREAESGLIAEGKVDVSTIPEVAMFPDVLKQRKKVALSHRVLPEYLVSKDATTALIYARVRPGFDNPPDAPLITNAAKKVLEKLKRTDHEFYMTGGTAINTAFKESAESDMSRIMPILLGITILLLFLRFRSVAGVILPLLVVIWGTIGAFGFGGWIDIEVSTITITLPQIMIAVGVADAIHILTSYFLARRRGEDRKEATRYTLSKNLKPTILTTISTALGFAAFVTASLKPIIGLGIIAAAGTLVAWLATYLLVGGLLVLLPWKVKKVDTVEGGVASERSKRWAKVLDKHRLKIVVVGFALAGVSIFLSLKNTVNSDPYKYFAEGYPLRDAQDIILKDMGGALTYEVVVDSGKKDGIKDPDFLKRVEQLEKQALDLKLVGKSVSIVEIVKQVHETFYGNNPEYYRIPDTTPQVAQLIQQYSGGLPQGMGLDDSIDYDYQRLRIRFISKTTASSEWLDNARLLERKATALGLNAIVTGKSRLYQGMNDHVVESFIRSLLTAVVLISLLLLCVFRSLRVGLIAIIPNVIPLMVGGLTLWIIGKPIDIGTVLVASVCIGIAVDDTIHILSSYDYWRNQGDASQVAIGKVFSGTGPALVVTTAILVAAFGMYAFGTFVPNVYFGILTATVLIAALITDMVFLPALLMLLEGDEKES